MRPVSNEKRFLQERAIRSDLKAVKLKRGGQTFLSRLEQMIVGSLATVKKPAFPAATPPPDPAAALAKHAAQVLGTQLIACEERFPEGDNNSVLVIVVDRNAAVWRERLRLVHEKILASRCPGSPEYVELEVIDRSTEEAVRRLRDAGLLQMRIRATRHLHPEAKVSEAPLSEEERARIDAHRMRFERKLKMGRILGAEELLDEARDAIREAILYAARANALQARLREPANAEETILPPVATCWGENRPLIQHFLAGSNDEVGPIIHALQKLLG
jgi:hypothetical protein